MGSWFPESRPISDGARDFIGRLLTTDVAARPTVDEALQHPWLGEHAPDHPLSRVVLASMRQFETKTEFQQLVLKVGAAFDGWRFVLCALNGAQVMTDLVPDHEVKELQETCKRSCCENGVFDQTPAADRQVDKDSNGLVTIGTRTRRTLRSASAWPSTQRVVICRRVQERPAGKELGLRERGE